MALMQLNFESRYLYGNTDVNIILPDRGGRMSPAEFYGSGRKYKVLWLLHGTSGDHTDWVRRTRIELYASERDMIVVMPGAMNSNYANWPKFSLGFDMYDFLTEELMPLVYGWLPASDRREDNYIAGLSMGGRGTLVYALNHPEKFAGAAVLSACPRDMEWSRQNEKGMYERLSKAAAENYGSMEAYLDSYENTWRLIDEKAHDPGLPGFYFASGTKDHLHPAFEHFREHAEKLGLKAKFDIIEGYSHEWRFWDLTIEKALEYFGIEKKG